MRHSLRLRLLLLLVTVPTVALAFVAVASRLSNDSNFDGHLKFKIAPVQRAGGGPTGVNDSNEIPVFETELDLNEQSQPVTFDSGTGDAFTIQAQPGFVEAYERDRNDTLAAINRQVTVAAAGVAVIALIAAFWLSQRIVRPVEQMTEAARRMESGDLTQRVEIGSSDEIGTLAHAFNAMASSLERNEDLRKQLTSDVAHELRTPLNNISGYLEAISDQVLDPTPAVIASLREESELLVRLVADLEQLSLADAGHQVLARERISLAQVAERAVALVAPRARARGIEIQSRLAAAAFVEGDPGRLGQVVRNLLENAVRHTPESGTVSVAIEGRERQVQLEVRDSGSGIAEQHLPYIFERFYRADPSRTRATGGAGLGLAIVRQLVEAHGGIVTASNIPGSGACFRVELPAAEPLPSKSPNVAAKQAPVRQS